MMIAITTIRFDDPESFFSEVDVLGALTTDVAEGTVIGVIDGDTIRVVTGDTTQTVRLLGIDAPEIAHGSVQLECYGEESTTTLARMVEGKVVDLEADESQGDLDKYGRLLRYVWVNDDTLVNNEMLLRGAAFEYTYDKPYQYQPLFNASELLAKQQGSGLWSLCSGL